MDDPKLTDEQYQSIEDCGAAEMTIEETCEIVEITPDSFFADTEAQRRFHKGQLLSKLKIRQAVVRMAREGMPQMVKLYQDFAKESLTRFSPDRDNDPDEDPPQLDMSTFAPPPDDEEEEEKTPNRYIDPDANPYDTFAPTPDDDEETRWFSDSRSPDDAPPRQDYSTFAPPPRIEEDK